MTAETVHVRDTVLGPATTAEVDDFAERFHYTGTGGSAMWRWGLFHRAQQLGVVAYNWPTRSVCASVFGDEHWRRVWHMGRLVMTDDAPKNSESRLIGASLRAIEREHPDVWAVVTYAAPDAGHIGTVYQATNALYCGLSDPRSVRYYRDASGARRSTRLNGHYVSRERAYELGWTFHTGARKHRYLYLLGSRTKRRQAMRLLRWQIEPYPKRCDGCEIDPFVGGNQWLGDNHDKTEARDE